MLVGHFGVAIAAKVVAPDLPLPALMLGTQAMDVVWGSLILAKVEKVRIVPGFTATAPLDLYYMPYSHSLLSAVLISLASTALLAAIVPGVSLFALGVFFAVCLSHWFLDFLVHIKDLPLIGNLYKVGLGLWNYRGASIATEFGLLLGGSLLYYLAFGAAADPFLLYAGLISVSVMCAVQLSVFFGPTMSPSMMATTALVFYVISYGFGSWVDGLAGF
ncbi:MAG: hypothetical protein ACRBBS_06215 [Thalassovita sp.]